jgi:Tol biopolymer transport system component
MKRNSQIYLILVSLFANLLFACNSKPNIDNIQITSKLPVIFPDYTGVTIPPNIAPLNFHIEEKGRAYSVSIEGVNGKEIEISGKDLSVDIPIKKWRKLLEENKGETLLFTVSIQDYNKKWLQYEPFNIDISNDDIDGNLVYRLINVGYILWKRMGIYQRDITSFKERSIMLNRNSDGNCMNCHSFSRNRPEYMMFHMRGKHGGTVISTPDSIFKVETNTAQTLASGAYPSWHPDGKHIAFSVNVIRQFFHSVEKGNEVYDQASDIVVYDIEKNTITTNPAVAARHRESLPNWSPDGKYIYFCRAPSFYDSLTYNEVFYDLMRIGFDVKTSTWGKVDTVLLAADIGGSISFPRISPNGRFLMFTKASHGYFTIYNNNSNLMLYDLEKEELIEYPFNSETVDSYHHWSGNSRWIVFSSKRIDGLTTRPHITYIDENGKAKKPFVLPQKDPLFYKSFNVNYNRPELVSNRIRINNLNLLEKARGEAIHANFDDNVNVDALSGATAADASESLH